jgi:hypothetical protein
MPPFCPRTAVNSQHPSPTARSEPEVNPSVDLYDAAWRTLVMRRSSARAAWRRSGRPSTANRREGLQFGLQFTAVRCRPRRTGQGDWSSLNRSGRSRPELLMRLGFTPFRGSNPRASAAVTWESVLRRGLPVLSQRSSWPPDGPLMVSPGEPKACSAARYHASPTTTAAGRQ